MRKQLSPLKIGFIGGGIESAVGNVHQIASRMDHRWILKAGCFSRNAEINKTTADRWGDDNFALYSDWKQLLSKEQGKIDAVVILTPTPKHYEIVMFALEIGMPVICEKALTQSYREAKDISDLLNKKKGFLAVTYNYTGYPMLRELKELIRLGKLGKLGQIQIEMPQEGFARLDSERNVPKPQGWRLEDGNIPTIALDLGVHLHHMIYFISGEKPVKVVADHSTYGWFEHIVDNVMCIAQCTGGLRTQMWYSKCALGYRNGLKVRVFGDKGSVEWYQMQPEEIKLYTVSGENIVIDRASDVYIADKYSYNRFKAGHPSGFIEAFANLYNDIADSLIEYNKTGKYNSNWIYGSNIALEGLKMFEAVSESSKENQWVKVYKSDAKE